MRDPGAAGGWGAVVLGAWGDRHGRKRMLVIGMTLMGLTFGPMSAVLPELFPANVRYSGVAISANIASAVSGLLPFLATAMNASNETPSSTPGIVILAVTALITAFGGFAGEKHRREDDVIIKD